MLLMLLIIVMLHTHVTHAWGDVTRNRITTPARDIDCELYLTVNIK